MKMSDFVFMSIKRASVTFFPVSPLIRTPVNTDAINRVPLYCLYPGCSLKFQQVSETSVTRIKVG